MDFDYTPQVRLPFIISVVIGESDDTNTTKDVKFTGPSVLNVDLIDDVLGINEYTVIVCDD